MSSQAVPVVAPAAPVVPQIADPAPLGLAGFAMTTMVLSVFNAGLLNGGLEATVLPLAFFYGGLAQLLAGMWEFRKGNTFGALAFSSFGAFWLSYYLFVANFAAKLTPAGQVHKAVGLFDLAWAIFTLYMTVAAMRTSGAVLAVFVALELTFIFLTIGNFAEQAAHHPRGRMARTRDGAARLVRLVRRRCQRHLGSHYRTDVPNAAAPGRRVARCIRPARGSRDRRGDCAALRVSTPAATPHEFTSHWLVRLHM